MLSDGLLIVRVGQGVRCPLWRPLLGELVLQRRVRETVGEPAAQPVAVCWKQEAPKRLVVRARASPEHPVEHHVALHAQLVVEVHLAAEQHQVFEAAYPGTTLAVEHVHAEVVPARRLHLSTELPVVCVGTGLAVGLPRRCTVHVKGEGVARGRHGARLGADLRQRHPREARGAVQLAGLLEAVVVHAQRVGAAEVAIVARQLRGAACQRARRGVQAVACEGVLPRLASPGEDRAAVRASAIPGRRRGAALEAQAVVPQERRVGRVVAVRCSIRAIAALERQRDAVLAGVLIHRDVVVEEQPGAGVDARRRLVERRSALPTGVEHGRCGQGAVLHGGVVAAVGPSTADASARGRLVWAHEVVGGVLPRGVRRVPVLAVATA
eukprot:480343-Hanusia_phi.AAC.2